MAENRGDRICGFTDKLAVLVKMLQPNIFNYYGV